MPRYLAMPLSAALLITGCSQFDEPRGLAVVREEVFVHIKLVDELHAPRGKRYGQAECVSNICTIYLLRQHYPFCLAHEVRHLFEGRYHGDRASLEDCQLATPL